MVKLPDIETLLKRGETAKALRAAQAAAKRTPRDPNAFDMLARSQIAAGQHRHAAAAYDKLIRLAPKHPKPLADKALLLQQIGDLDGAEVLLRRALKLAPLNGSLLRMLGQGTRLSTDDSVIERALDGWTSGEMSRADRIHAGFALAKALGRDGFGYLKAANELQRQSNPWKIEKRRGEVAALQAAFEAVPWPELPAQDTGHKPIFVTGMPRSGTTLVEQVLAAHPQVTATGETGLPLRAVYSVLGHDKGFRPMSSLSPKELHLIAERYLSGMDHFHAPGSIYTDKTIPTYQLMGLLHHVLPEARTIVVHRDPRDIGWSIYRNHFVDGTHGYSNDMSDIAAYMATMRDMVAFWRERRPDAFIEVDYEDLVRDPEPQVRAMLDYCGLDWDPACLSPEKNKGAVRTLSVEQVRSPISPASIGGWRSHEAELAPLIDSLKDHGLL